MTAPVIKSFSRYSHNFSGTNRSLRSLGPIMLMLSLVIPDLVVLGEEQQSAGAAKTTKLDLFSTDKVLMVEITVARADWDKIRNQKRNFFTALSANRRNAEAVESPYTYVNASVKIGGVEFPQVGIRKKGFLGSLNSERPSLKVKLHHVDKKASLNGLSMLTFNNNQQDVSLMSQAMGYALLAGLPPIHGLYASVAPILLYAVFGTSRHLAVGPVAMDSILVAASVGAIAEVGTEQYVLIAAAVGMMVGVIQAGLGFVRAGFLVNFLSRPVVAAAERGLIDMWVRARPEAGGVALAVIDWHERAAALDPAEMQRREADLAALARAQLDVVHRGADRDEAKRHGVAGLDVGAVAALDGVADVQPARGEDVGLLAI